MVAFSRLRCTHKDPNDDKKHYGLPKNLDQMSRVERQKVLLREIEISKDGEAGLGKDARILNEFFHLLKVEVVNAGFNWRCEDEVLSYTEEKRQHFLKIIQLNSEELTKEQKFHLSNICGFLRRIQETSNKYMIVLYHCKGLKAPDHYYERLAQSQ